MITLFKNATVYSPFFEGQKDVMVAGKRIIAIKDSINLPPELDVHIVECEGNKLIPGLVDAHVHITGGGGEGGPGSRMPELQLSMMVEAGVTTVVGCLGAGGINTAQGHVFAGELMLRHQRLDLLHRIG